MKIPSQKKLFRDVDNAMISGVCAGLARHLDVDAVWVRAAAIAGLFFVSVPAVIAYFAAVILLPRMP